MVMEFTRPSVLSPEKAEKNKIVSAVFNRLVLKITSRYPAVVGPGNYQDMKLTPSEDKAISYIRNKTNPFDLTQMIFNHPPSVVALVGENFDERVTIESGKMETIDPTDAEQQLAVKTTHFPDELAELADQFRKYIMMPKRKDDFTSHKNQRAPWRLGIHKVLSLIGRDWDREFNDIWVNNRYSRGKTGNLMVVIEVLIRSKGLSGDLQYELLKIYMRMHEADLLFDDEDVDVDLITNSFVEESSNVMNLFS